MASFVKSLEELLAHARSRGVVTPETSQALLDMGREQDRRRHMTGLTAILGWLGGAVIVVGVILLVAANWESIPGFVKIAGFLALLAGAHGGALWIRWKEKPYPLTASALHFIGAGLVLAGVGLIAQVYNLHDRPPDGVLVWVIAIVPLAVLLESAPIAVMSIVAVLVWGHMEGAFSGSPLEMPDSFAAHIMLEIGLGVALFGFAGLLRRRNETLAAALRVSGLVLVAALLYVCGFYRYWSDNPHSSYYWTHSNVSFSINLPFAALAHGAIGLTLGWRRIIEGSRTMRALLIGLLAVVLAIAAVAAAADVSLLPRGPEIEQWQFGWSSHCDLVEWVVSVAAWLAWFALSAWCLVHGTTSGAKGLVNLGVVGVGLGVVTRFFDLAGGLASTGWMFILGGAALFGTGWAMERWRRRLIRGMEDGV